MHNLESSRPTRWGRKPHQCDPKATPKPYTRHILGSTEPPQSHTKAPRKLQQSANKATPARAKSEIRGPKSEGNPKTEARKKLLAMGGLHAGAVPGSDFGSRISGPPAAFNLQPAATPKPHQSLGVRITCLPKALAIMRITCVPPRDSHSCDPKTTSPASWNHSIHRHSHT